MAARKRTGSVKPGFKTNRKTLRKAKRIVRSAAKPKPKVGKGRTKLQQLEPKTTRRRKKAGLA